LGAADAALLLDELHPDADGHALLATRFAEKWSELAPLSP
jgi:lysophospholipase L1-like esterase